MSVRRVIREHRGRGRSRAAVEEGALCSRGGGRWCFTDCCFTTSEAGQVSEEDQTLSDPTKVCFRRLNPSSPRSSRESYLVGVQFSFFSALKAHSKDSLYTPEIHSTQLSIPLNRSL
jgi:hypothetical protein